MRGAGAAAPPAARLRRLERPAIIVLLALAICVVYAITAGGARGAEPGASLKWKARSTVTAPVSRHAAAPTGEVKLVSYYDADLRPAQAVQPVDDPFNDKSRSAPVAQPPQPFLPPSSPNDPGGLPTIPPNREFAAAGGFAQEPCPELSEFKKIGAITNQISASPGDLPKECIIDESIEYPMNRPWCQTVYTWKASGMCHKPLYFEEEALERYGHSTGPFTQSLVSGAHFFGTLPLLPYKMGMDPPGECKYALGYYRPGSCAPYIIGGVPISARGIAAETAAVLGMIYLVP